jgi:Flp pilus assembly protein TadG
MRRQPSVSRSFIADQRGSIALLFAICSTAILIIVGLAIDGARSYNIAGKVGASLDAAALTGASMLNETSSSDAQVQTAVQATLDAELQHLGVGGVTISTTGIVLDRPNSAVTVNASVTLQTMFGIFAGAPTINFNKSSTTTYQLAKLEVVLALDITGSMNQTPAGDTQPKIDTLKSVASNVVNSLFDLAQTDDNIRIGIVPWSASVNAGPYADLVTGVTSTSGWWSPGWGYHSASSDCITERSGGADVTDVAPAPGNYASPLGTGGACPADQIAPLTGRANRSAIVDTIGGFTATGSTAGHLGTAWAWYLISPQWASFWPSGSQPDPYATATVKNVIILTDGIFNTDYVGGVMVGAYDDMSYSLFQQNCTGMRANGINVYTIALDLTDARAQSELQTCAGASGNYFNATNAATLNAAFAAIIKKMTTVRVSK